MPPGATTVQILVAGNTYNRAYWQADVEPVTYSYVRQANLAGYATLAIDRLGTGSSLHPPSRDMTFGNDVRTVHEVAGAVRASGHFDRVVGVGHSLGSIVVNQVAGDYPGDLDGVVLTGFSHSINVVNAGARVASRYALTAGDARFAGLGLDPLYVTTQPGGRNGFYATAAVAPDILAWDDRTRDVANLVEMAGFSGFQIPNASRAIDVPVFLVNGGDDAVACGLGSGDCGTAGRLRDAERPWFGRDADVAAWVVPGLGHSVTLHRNAPSVNARITAWIGAHVGRGSGFRGSAPGAIPAPAAARAAPADPAALAANQALLAVTPGLADAYVAAVRPVPGLGAGGNPVPLSTAVLRGVGDLPLSRTR